MIRGDGQPPVGPESFAVAPDGNILIADVVNQRVVVCDRDGTHVRSLGLPGIALGDVFADQQGRVYVYDQVRRALHQYDAEGISRSTLNLNPRDIDTRGYFHATGQAVYFADAATRDVLVGTLRDGLLSPPDESAERMTDGIHGESGCIYCLAVDKDRELWVEIHDPAARWGARKLQVAVPGIVSARYVGEDEAQRFYVQTERVVGTGVVLTLLTFSSTGEPLTATRMPENDYALWTAKLVDVGRDGTIVQFLPQRDQARLNIFAN